MAWNDPSTWLPNVVLTAAQLNAQVRDNFKAIGDPWTPYTPSWTGSSVNPGIGNGSVVGRFIRAGKLVRFRVVITMGTTTSYGTGQYRVSLPTAAHPDGNQVVEGESLIGSGVAVIRGRILAGGSSVYLYCSPTTAGAFDRAVTDGTPAGFAAGSQIVVSGTYEAG